MKKALGVGLLVVLCSVALYLFFNRTNPAPPSVAPPTQQPTASQDGSSPRASPASSASPASNSPNAVSSQYKAQPESLASRAGQVVPDSPGVTNLPPEIVLQNVRRAIHQYGEMFGGNPVGTNPEITSQLSGDNPKHINFIAAQAGMQIDAQGELIDAWGTPYFFHQMSGAETEVHSAGPDKIMWTSDDLVVK